MKNNRLLSLVTTILGLTTLSLLLFLDLGYDLGQSLTYLLGLYGVFVFFFFHAATGLVLASRRATAFFLGKVNGWLALITMLLLFILPLDGLIDNYFLFVAVVFIWSFMTLHCRLLLYFHTRKRVKQ